MKLLQTLLALHLFALSCHTVLSSSIADVIEQTSKKLIPSVPSTDAVSSIFTTNAEEKEIERTKIRHALNSCKTEEKSFNNNVSKRIQEIKNKINHTKEQLNNEPNNEFLEKELTILGEIYRILKELKQLYEKLISNYEHNLKLHDAYLIDPHFKQIDKDLGICDERHECTLEQFQDLSQRIRDQKKTISQLYQQKKNIQLELENRNQDMLMLADKNIKKIEKVDDNFELDAYQQKLLAELEITLEQDRKALSEIRKHETEQRKELIKMEVFLAELQLDKLQTALKAIKPFISVQESTIAQAHDELVKKRQFYFDAQDTYDQRIEIITQRQKEIEKTLQQLVSKSSITLGPDIDDWSREPVQSIAGYFELFEIASLNTSILLLNRQREFIEVQRTLADRILKEETVYLDIKKTFQKLISHACTPEEVVQEKKKYESPNARAKADELSCTAQKGEANVYLERQKKALTNITNKRQALHAQRSMLFKHHAQEYTRCLELLNGAETKVKRQIDLITKLIAKYDESILFAHKTIKHIDFIMVELDGEVMWGRSAHAVSWRGIKRSWSDIISFFHDIYGHVQTMQFKSVLTWLTYQITHPLHFFIYTSILLLFALALIALQKGIVLILTLLKRIDNRAHIFHILCMLCIMIAEYFNYYFVYWASWLMLFFAINLYVVNDPYPYILFYLFSIIYVIGLESAFVHYFAGFNRLHNNIFLSASLEQQFLTILATLLYVSSSLLLFREAFLLGTQQESELPAILLATTVIIFQIALIFLLAKIIEQISNSIPTKTERLIFIRSTIDRYHYLILIFLTIIMILSNPSVGFGNLVVYVLGRAVLTMLVIGILLLIHQFLKYISSFVFFYSENGIVRERFSHGKTWYGLFVILMFLTFMALGSVVIAKVWRWPENIADISGWSDILIWLRTPIMLEKTADVPISVFSVLEVIGFVLAGVITALAINRIVFAKIFNVLMIDSGAQNAIASIASYVIVALATIFGFQAVGRGDLVVWILGALALGLGWIVKDPLGDFIAYFIILVQRPIKIGDYIWIDEINMGVVRKITPRAVIIRKRNSTMIIIPNMTIITRPLTNWNYQRGFIAFEDISVRIGCNHDPSLVKTILEQVLEANSFVLKSPRPVVRLNEFDDYGCVFIVRGYISTNYTLEQWDIASDVRLAIIKELAKNNITLATKTRIMFEHKTEQSVFKQENETPDF